MYLMFCAIQLLYNSYIEAGNNLNEMTKIRELPDIRDCNDLQEFVIPPPNTDNQCRYIRITFQQSTDFYGRITIYSLRVMGSNVDI